RSVSIAFGRGGSLVRFQITRAMATTMGKTTKIDMIDVIAMSVSWSGVWSAIPERTKLCAVRFRTLERHPEAEERLPLVRVGDRAGEAEPDRVRQQRETDVGRGAHAVGRPGDRRDAVTAKCQ